jgi:biotin operon repressor
MLTLRQMEAVVWIAQLGTFERAAARLGTSQSAISKRINELEEQIGFPLFDRSQRGSKFTPPGRGSPRDRPQDGPAAGRDSNDQSWEQSQDKAASPDRCHRINSDDMAA